MAISPIIQAWEASQMRQDIPQFSIGDTIVVEVRVVDTTTNEKSKEKESRERLQKFEGVVIAKRNRGWNSAFTVRKLSHGEGVERVFQTHSPLVASIKLLRKGDVRRAKLYYIRSLSAREGRIKEKIVRKQQNRLGHQAVAVEHESGASEIVET